MANTGKSNNYKWVILGVATISQAAASFFMQGIGPLAGYFKQNFDLNDTQIGMLSSASQFLPVIGLLIAGELLDRFSERVIVGAGAVGVALALLLGAYTNSYIGILLCLLVVGGFYSTAQPGGAKSVASWFPKSQRGFAMGIRQAGLPLGGALAGISLPFIAANYGLKIAFFVGAIVTFLGGCIFLTLYRSPHIDTTSDGSSPKLTIRETIKERTAMLSEPYMKNIIWSGIPLVLVQYVISIFIATYFHHVYNLSLETSAYLFFIAQAFGVAGRIGLAAWSDHSRKGRFFPVFCCFIALIAGILVLLVNPFHSIIFLTIIAAWIGFFGLGWYGPWVAYIADVAPPERVGFALGLAMSLNQIAIILTPPTFGFLQDTTNSYTPTWLIIIGVLCIASFLTRNSLNTVKKSQ